MRPAIELGLMVALVLAELWLPLSAEYEPVRWVVRCAAAALWIVSYRHALATRHADSTPAAGRLRAWRETLLATLLIALALAFWLAWVREPYEGLTAPAASLAGGLAWLARRFALAMVQQLVLQRFIWRQMRQLLSSETAAVACAAALFGLLHLPSVALATATFLAALVWISLFRRTKRLAPLVVSHALLAGLASLSVPERLFYEMRAGAVALPAQPIYRQLARPETRSLLRELTSEAYLEHRSGTREGFVAGLYRDVLGRPATDEEIRRGASSICCDRSSARAALAKALVTSDEAVRDDRTLRGIALDIEPLPPAIILHSQDLHSQDLHAQDLVADSGWHDEEAGWRWARSQQPIITFPLQPEAQRAYLLTLSCGARLPQSVKLRLDDSPLGEVTFETFEPTLRRVAFAGQLLAAREHHTLRLDISGERAALAPDPRPLGLGLRSLEVRPLRFPSVAISHLDDAYFLRGFSAAEKNLRWSQASEASLVYPLRDLRSTRYAFELLAGALGDQTVEIRLNGHPIASWSLAGLTPQLQRVEIAASQLRTPVNTIELLLPDAHKTKRDPRTLGIAFVSARLYPIARDES
ncbi:MAG: CPBP family glutamic-type intramembrane protease [Acidobacteriota bacterium]